MTDDAAARIRLGNPVIVRGRDAPVEADEACATARGKLVAIGAIEAGMFKPKRVFRRLRIVAAPNFGQNRDGLQMRPAKPQTLTARGPSGQGASQRSPIGSPPGTLIADPEAMQSALSLT